MSSTDDSPRSVRRHHPYRSIRPFSARRMTQQSAATRARQALTNLLDEDAPAIKGPRPFARLEAAAASPSSGDNGVSSPASRQSSAGTEQRKLMTKLRDLEAQKLSAEVRAERLELELQSAVAERKREEIKRDELLQEKDKVIDDYRERDDEWKRQRKFMVQREEALRLELAEVKESSRKKQTDLQKTVSDLQRDNVKLRDEILTLQQEASQASLAALEAKNSAIRHERSVAEEQIAQLEAKIRTQQSELAAARTSQYKAEHLDNQVAHLKSSLKEAQSALEELQHGQGSQMSSAQMLRLRQLERENKYLRDVSESNQKLKEMLNVSDERLERANQRIEELQAFKTQYESLESLKNEWDRALEELARFQADIGSPLDLTRALAQTQQQLTVVLAEKGDAAVQLSQMERRLKEMRDKYKSASEKLLEVELQTEQSSMEIEELQRKLRYHKADRTSMQEFIDAIKSVSPAAGSSFPADQEIANLQKRLKILENAKDQTEEALQGKLKDAQQRLQTLTLQLEEAKAQTADLEEKLSLATQSGKHAQFGCFDHPTGMSASSDAMNASNSEADVLRDQLKNTTAQKVQAERRVAELEKRLAASMTQPMDQGADSSSDASTLQLNPQEPGFIDYDPTKTKVVHLKDNPVMREAKRRAAELEQARVEIATLKARLDKTQSSPGASSAAAATSHNASDDATSVDPNMVAELEKTKEELRSSEKRLQRLKEVYQKNVQEFREACYELTGYQIHVSAGSQYMLRSMFAESREDYLLFQSSSRGMEVLETPYSQRLSNDLLMYLQRFHSIPAFLSAVTLDLFGKQTMMLSS